jgi:hypothetical protein
LYGSSFWERRIADTPKAYHQRPCVSMSICWMQQSAKTENQENLESHENRAANTNSDCKPSGILWTDSASLATVTSRSPIRSPPNLGRFCFLRGELGRGGLKLNSRNFPFTPCLTQQPVSMPCTPWKESTSRLKWVLLGAGLICRRLAQGWFADAVWSWPCWTDQQDSGSFILPVCTKLSVGMNVVVSICWIPSWNLLKMMGGQPLRPPDLLTAAEPYLHSTRHRPVSLLFLGEIVVNLGVDVLVLWPLFSFEWGNTRSQRSQLEMSRLHTPDGICAALVNIFSFWIIAVLAAQSQSSAPVGRGSSLSAFPIHSNQNLQTICPEPHNILNPGSRQ